MTGTRQRVQRISAAEAALLPVSAPIVNDPTTSALTEPYVVMMMDDDGTVSAMVQDHLTYQLTRTYWPGHADSRWAPTRVATTAPQVRALLALRPMQLVAVPESLVHQMYRGWNFALTCPDPE